MKKTFIDLEFTKINGEILALQVLDLETKVLKKKVFNTKENISAKADIVTGGIYNFDRSNMPFFSLEEFRELVPENSEIYLYGGQGDIKAINEAIGKSILGYFECIDLQQVAIIWMAEKYKDELLTSGRGLDVFRYIWTNGEITNCHDGNELVFLYNFFNDKIVKKIIKLAKEKKESDCGDFTSSFAQIYFQCFNFLPYGRFVGKDIEETVNNERRAIDGYRYNNSDLLSSLYHKAIIEYDDNDEDEDYDY